MAKLFQLIVLMSAVIWRVSTQIQPAEDDKDILFDSGNYNEAKQQAKDNVIQLSLRICPNHTQQIQRKFEEFKKCSEIINEDNTTLCEVVEVNLKQCLVPLIDLFEGCVPKKAKGMPTYVWVTSQKLLRYICTSTGAHVLELGNRCILSRKNQSSKICFSQLKNELRKYNYDKLPEKTAICLFLDTFEDCFNNHVRDSCQDATTREAYIGLYQNFRCTKYREI